ncbi:MAG: NAD(P)H-dependent oxidoreductase subunit E [Candidatus Cryptobacteroides sp.]|jgi:NADH-quinone oxidoreductase subunit E/NADP-reducing hydrogenase subunit HndA|nr:NAD(P)H-dependent oxidoreductase subunit E [Bacteroidota bacterium]NLN99873.1 NAD(P)H-dependent oxidoreductase subunit E [Bacteroidales bacterium]
MDNMKLSCTAAAKIDEICEEHGNDAGELINILHETQKTFGYLPHEVQVLVAKKLGIPVNRVNGVVSFYTFFTEKPKGKHIVSVCLGTACYVRGAEKVLDEAKKVLGIEVGQTTPDGIFSLDSLRCVGACGLAPVVLVDGKVFGNVEPKNVSRILESIDPTA